MYLVGLCLHKLNFTVISFHCHCNIPEHTKLLNILNFLIGMLIMHVYISHSKRAITISFFIQYKPLKNCKIKGYQYILQNVSNDTIFLNSNL